MARVIHNVQMNQETFNKRFLISAAILLLAAMGILTRYFWLQVVEYETYKTQSDNNRIHLNVISPNRGRIYARDGSIIAQNFPSFVMHLMRGRMKNLDKELEILQRLLDLDDETIADFRKHLKQGRAYDAVPMKYELTERERAIIAANRHLLPGVSISVKLIRQYPHQGLFSHAVGYVGRISARDEERLDMERYVGVSHTGKIGLEASYEDQLFGAVGYEQVETDVRGKVLRELDRIPPKAGQDLRLFIDMDSQKKATELLEGEVGAVVAIDTKTGGVVTFVSMPNYNTNLFVNGISHKDYNELRDSIDIPLFNRTIRGLYPPASTVKPFIALGALHLGVSDTKRSVRDPGWYSLAGDRRKYRDWKRRGHGTVNMRYAIEQSCDVYYYDLAYKMGISNLSPFMKSFGFGHKTGIDLGGEKSGLMPSGKWKKENRGTPWYPGDTLNTGIGQGFSQASPLQLAQATAIMANRGHVITPRLVQQIGNTPTVVEETAHMNISQEHWDFIHEAMKNVVHSNRGTARRLGYKGWPFKMAGKSGTAQVVGIKQGERYDSAALAKKKRDHALFVAFAPVENPRVAVAVIVENGESGSGKAGPIAAAVMDTYLKTLAREEGHASAEVEDLGGQDDGTS